MKNLVIISTVFLSSTLLAGEATIKIPINNEEGISVSEVNKKLKKLGKATIPEVFELSTKEKNFAYKKYQALNEKIVNAYNQVGEEFDWYYDNIPNTEKKGTCYTGDATKVSSLVFALTDMIYSDQLNLWGWKYKKQTYIHSEYDEDTSETERTLNEGSKLWRNWRGNGEAVLLVTAYTDSGDDINESIIPRCQE